VKCACFPRRGSVSQSNMVAMSALLCLSLSFLFTKLFRGYFSFGEWAAIRRLYINSQVIVCNEYGCVFLVVVIEFSDGQRFVAYTSTVKWSFVMNMGVFSWWLESNFQILRKPASCFQGSLSKLNISSTMYIVSSVLKSPTWRLICVCVSSAFGQARRKVNDLRTPSQCSVYNIVS
jgi:hypothetical protein